MTKAEQYISELRKLETPKNRAIVEGIIDGFSAILIESYKKCGMDPDAYAEMESHRIRSGLSTKAFVESVGQSIINSGYSDGVKSKLMKNLEKYSKTI